MHGIQIHCEPLIFCLFCYVCYFFLCIQATTNKIQENAGMLTEAEIETVESRADVITYTVLAEMEHFQRNRVVDFEVYMQRYLHGQIAFYRQVYCITVLDVHRMLYVCF